MLLRGLVRYSREHGSWLFRRLKLNGWDDGILKLAREWGADAIVGQWSDEAVERLKELGIPIVLQNYHHRSTTYSNLTGNYGATGQMAARFFAARQFHDFAFFGTGGVIWSDERREGFRAEVERTGGGFHCYEYDNDRELDTAGLEAWLAALPKPVALFCCDDAHAQIVSETCKVADIAIPDEVSLLGVDNDELVCNVCDPPISSIELDVEKGGYTLAKMLHRQMKGELSGPFSVVIEPVRIELRQSTEKHNIEDPHVLDIVKQIEAGYRGNLTIKSLTEQTPLSRRNIELKFKSALGTSMYQYLLEFRVNRFADLLITTDRSIVELAVEAGFRDYSNISRVFKKIKGTTPQQYRAENRASE
jgi:LacI family transcriptional regulator